jgi:putative FmdB family regulatory protein
MPTYEYRCPSGHEFELLQKMTDSTRAKCPECGRIATRQISGGAGLIFKGSGFYITDYGKDGKGPRQEKETESKPDSAPAAADAAPPASAKPESAAPAERTGKPEKTEKAEKSPRKKPRS